MKSRILLAALALAGAGLGAAQAATATTSEQPQPPAAATPKPAATAHRAATTRASANAKHVVKAKHAAHARRGAKSPRAMHAKARPTAMDRVHEHVAFAREAEQRRWIAGEVQSGRLDRAKAASLWDAAAELAREQAMLARRGHETTVEALAISHRQDQLDWAIRSGEVAFAPQARPTAG